MLCTPFAPYRPLSASTSHSVPVTYVFGHTQFSVKDADAYPEYEEFLGKIRELVNPLLDGPPPDLFGGKRPEKIRTFSQIKDMVKVCVCVWACDRASILQNGRVNCSAPLVCARIGGTIPPALFISRGRM